jgi:transcription elongation factor GreB
VAEERPSDPSAIYFGAVFELENAESGELVRYRIVGPDETDASQGFISVDSPLARAVLRKRVDDEFEVELPLGKTSFVVVSVTYQEK